ncbi:MAG: hypothetical protein A3K46_07780 [Chloroflexi bacterium RBG_13_60_9]|nr:MAG: hypothetical protein A3K46_07780 [Chloroflexi bacterium RBG_13_60_9]
MEIRINTEELKEKVYRIHGEAIAPVEDRRKVVEDSKSLIREDPSNLESFRAKVEPLIDAAAGEIGAVTKKMQEANDKIMAVIRYMEAVDSASAEELAALQAQYPELMNNPELALMLIMEMDESELQSFLSYGSLLSQSGTEVLGSMLTLLSLEMKELQAELAAGNREDAEILFPEHVSPDLVGFVKDYESLVLPPRDVGDGMCTAGYGHVLGPAPCTAKQIKTWTEGGEDMALSQLTVDLQKAEEIIKQYVNVPLSQQQFDALVSLVFNYNYKYVKKDLIDKLNEGTPEAYAAVPELMLQFNKVNGKEWPGLTRRREEEGEIWNSGEYIRDQ